MMLFFWQREGRFILTIAAWLIVIGAVVFGAVNLFGLYRHSRMGSAAEEFPDHQYSPLPSLPIVTYTEGYPEVKRGNADIWELVETGNTLDQSCVIRTDETSSLDIRIQSESVIRVMENTIFSLESLYQQKVDLKVEKGAVIARIKRLLNDQLFDFRSPSVVAGIRGTELIVTTEPEGTTVYGMSGRIEVVSPEFPDKKVFVNLHEKSFVKEGEEPSESVPMSIEEIERYRKLLDSLRENPVFIVGDNISFLPDSIQLTPEALIVLKAIYEQLQAVQGNIIVVGHTADIGSPESQIEISEGRAQAVVDYLVTLGMPPARLRALGVGSRQPVSYSEEGMDKNRRVEFVIE